MNATKGFYQASLYSHHRKAPSRTVLALRCPELEAIRGLALGGLWSNKPDTDWYTRGLGTA